MPDPNEFLASLTPEVFGVRDFFDWNAIEERLSRLQEGIAALAQLNKARPIEGLTELLLRKPQVLKVLHLLTAHAPREIHFADGRYVKFDEDLSLMQQAKLIAEGPREERAREISQIFYEMGLLNILLESKSVEDLVRGVLIGLEPNARKGRRGDAFEMAVEHLLVASIKEINDEYRVNLLLKPKAPVELEEEVKLVNFAVFRGDTLRAVVEANFYATGGSKPLETLTRAYPNLQDSLKRKGVGLIVITDGPGWRKMKSAVATMLQKLDYCFNLRQARSGRLKDALIRLALLS